MRYLLIIIVAAYAPFLLKSCGQAASVEQEIITPENITTRKADIHDTLFGKIISDPYRWLENPEDPEVQDWVEQQNAVTLPWLKQLPGRERIQERLTELFNYERISSPFQAGPYVFFYKNEGLQEHSPLYVQEGIQGEAELLLDPLDLSPDGTISISRRSASPEGRYLAVALSYAGSDWREIRVIDMESREFLDDQVKHVKFSSIAWVNEKGYYYSRYDDPATKSDPDEQDRFHKVYFHTIGTSQDEDRLVYDDPERPLRNFYVSTPELGDQIFMYASESGTRHRLVWHKSEPDGQFEPLIDSFFTRVSIMGEINGKYLGFTNYEAPNNRLILIDPQNPEPENWTDFIPEMDILMEQATTAGGHVVIRCLDRVVSRIFVYDMQGNRINEISLPGEGSVRSFSGRFEQNRAFYTYTSFNQPSSIYTYDFREHKTELFFTPELMYDPDEYTIRQVTYPSKDGTEIPMFLVHLSDIEMDGDRPVLLYGYGGFNISMRPGFSSSRIAFLEKGGIYAMPNLRGGGEFGTEWHKAGTKLSKQNTFDDFIAAAEFLIEEGYTNPEKIAISGRSNGGLLVGAAMTQRPDLFAAAIPEVGVLDMLRFHKFTIGWAWVSDYGSPDDSVEFLNLYSFSPLHNLEENTCYPATLIMTADHDNRVVPAHSYKFAARLQEVQSCENPALIRIDTKAGHGSGTPVSQVISASADRWAFLGYVLGMEF